MPASKAEQVLEAFLCTLQTVSGAGSAVPRTWPRDGC
jgi:hypothetical protein